MDVTERVTLLETAEIAVKTPEGDARGADQMIEAGIVTVEIEAGVEVVTATDADVDQDPGLAQDPDPTLQVIDEEETEETATETEKVEIVPETTAVIDEEVIALAIHATIKIVAIVKEVMIVGAKTTEIETATETGTVVSRTKVQERTLKDRKAAKTEIAPMTMSNPKPTQNRKSTLGLLRTTKTMPMKDKTSRKATKVDRQVTLMGRKAKKLPPTAKVTFESSDKEKIRDQYKRRIGRVAKRQV